MLQPNLFSFSTLWREGGLSKDAALGGEGEGEGGEEKPLCDLT